MAKELPYFQFEPATYLTGSIQFCSLAAQGLYINLISIYWQRECSLTVEQAQKRFNYPDQLNELINEKIIKVSGGKITIDFLLNQMKQVVEISKKRSISGKRGMAKRWPNSNKSVTKPLQTDNKPITIREDNIREDKIKEEYIPPVSKTDVTQINPLCLWIKKSLPNVAGMKNQLTDPQAEQLLKKFDKTLIREILEAMENKTDLRKKYNSVNLTIRSWIRLRQQKDPQAGIIKPKEDHSVRNEFYDEMLNQTKPLKAI